MEDTRMVACDFKTAGQAWPRLLALGVLVAAIPALSSDGGAKLFWPEFSGNLPALHETRASTRGRHTKYVVDLRTANPGYSGPLVNSKMWVYVPEGNHSPASLPSVVIAPAGYPANVGAPLVSGDEPEHLPYLDHGFIVVAYEMDGAQADRNAVRAEEVERFMRSGGGLGNFALAMRYLKEEVPAADPRLVFSVGHSSAARMALLVGSQDASLAGVVVYNPAWTGCAVEDWSPISASRDYRRFCTAHSTRRHLAEVSAPLFVFTSQTDRRVPVKEVEDLVESSLQAGLRVSATSVAVGTHHGSMISDGIPAGTSWMLERVAQKRGVNGL